MHSASCSTQTQFTTKYFLRPFACHILVAATSLLTEEGSRDGVGSHVRKDANLLSKTSCALNFGL